MGPSWASLRSFAQILWFWGHYETIWIWIDLFQNSILFCKYLGPLILHRNGFVFKICIWISVFRRKKRIKNPILGCQDIKQKSSLIFLGTNVLVSRQPLIPTDYANIIIVITCGESLVRIVSRLFPWFDDIILSYASNYLLGVPGPEESILNWPKEAELKTLEFRGS